MVYQPINVLEELDGKQNNVKYYCTKDIFNSLKSPEEDRYFYYLKYPRLSENALFGTKNLIQIQPNNLCNKQYNMLSNNQPNTLFNNQSNISSNNQPNTLFNNQSNTLFNNQSNISSNNQPNTLFNNQSNISSNNQPNTLFNNNSTITQTNLLVNSAHTNTKLNQINNTQIITEYKKENVTIIPGIFYWGIEPMNNETIINKGLIANIDDRHYFELYGLKMFDDSRYK
jgi:hypothetical protein